MKNITLAAAITAASAGFCALETQAHAPESKTHRPESHAPAGVMWDHTHRKDEWMLGLRTTHTRYRHYVSGSSKISDNDVPANYRMVAQDMDMTMYMLDIMYAPTDYLTLMVMPMWMTMDMTMNGNANHPMGRMMGEASMDTKGLADTQAGTMFRLNPLGESREVIATAAISIPTGSIEEENEAGTAPTHYDMQLGSGTWDAIPSLTYTDYSDQMSWGAQTGAIIRMESENSEGYRLGNSAYVTGWGGYRLFRDVSLTGRLAYRWTDQMKGEYEDNWNTASANENRSPADNPDNYGGETISAGVGMNYVANNGPLTGVRLGLEYIIPVHQDLNGVQLASEDELAFNLTYAF